MLVTKKGKPINYDEFIVRLPKNLAEKTSKQRSLNGMIIYIRPIYKKGKIVKMVPIGHIYCTKKTCDFMYGSCSACRINATTKAEEMLKKDDVTERAEYMGLVIPEGGILTP